MNEMVFGNNNVGLMQRMGGLNGIYISEIESRWPEKRKDRRRCNIV